MAQDGRALRDVEAPLAEWRTRVRTTFTELDVDPKSHEGFAGGLTLHRRGGIEIAEIRGAHQTVNRAQAGILRAPVDELYFVFQRRGSCLFEADGDGQQMATGDSVLYDMNRAHRLHFDGRFEHLCAKVPQSLVKERLGRTVAAQLGRSFIGSSGLGRVVGAGALAMVDPDVEAGEAEMLGDMFLDLLDRSLAGRADGRVAAPNGAAARADALRRFIAEHHRLEGLSPAQAASGLGCSLRQVHSIAAGAGTTFGRMLLEARMRSAHALLLRGARVSEAAFASGFADLSHFSRTFKAHHGRAPKLVRGAQGCRRDAGAA